ncbi:[acyl-carrier-protein] S-malonyltransferase [bacterium]|nr:[acyl-carrier-protein] S-malonyltransferase [bacterium]
MPSIAFVFPGQGSQKIGMGRDLAEKYPSARAVFDAGNKVLGRDIASICFEGPNEALTLTSNAQPAIFLVSAALLSVLSARGIKASYVAGHSLGELTAYYAAGVVDLETALRIIDVRGRGMAESMPVGQSGMAAVMGMAVADIERILEPFATRPVVIANLNCPGQVVISGERQALDEAIGVLKADGAKVIPLPVSGAFHSPLMMHGAKVLGDYVKSVALSDAKTPIILNRTAQPETRGDALKANLSQQVVSPVRWIETVECLAQTVDRVVEVGPGKVLAGLVKKTSPDLPVTSVSDVESLENWLAEIVVPL